MTSRQRVLQALNHQQPDRVPVDLGGTFVTGLHCSVVAALRDHFKLRPQPVKVHEPYQMLGYVDEDLKQAMGVDVEGVVPNNTIFGFPSEDYKPWRAPWGQELLVPRQFNVRPDADGHLLIFPAGDKSAPPSGMMPKTGFFFDSIIRQPPIDDDHLNVEDNLEEFAPLDEANLKRIVDGVRAAAAGPGERARLICTPGTALGDIALVPAPGLRYPKGIRDIEEWYCSTASRREYVREIFDRQTDIAIANLRAINQACGQLIDIAVLCGTDFGTQASQFCSDQTLRDLWLPYYKRMNDWIHANTAWKTFKHSCGAVSGFIDTFIDAGFDILNPVQCSATGMDPRKLKERWGDRITFWGGGIDTQRVFPFGTPDEVRAQVLERLEIFSPGGGYIFNTIHNIQAKTPVQNIIAMLDAINEFNGALV
ncbi:MAG: methyltransferase [Phycisphaerales bacterium]|jgi:uroporphyrinogen-III decarboxylase|nr:methyltransferase [Phycisphaerales bacterium]